jgi:hypothetical protein
MKVGLYGWGCEREFRKNESYGSGLSSNWKRHDTRQATRPLTRCSIFG